MLGLASFIMRGRSQAALVAAQRLNPLNTDHSANLARLSRAWAFADALGPTDNPTDSWLREILATPGNKVDEAHLDQALTYYQQAVALSPQNAQLWNELATVQFIRNDLAGAQASIDRSLTLEMMIAEGLLAVVSCLLTAAPEQLRCEGLTNPLGIDQATPRFSWAIPPGGRGLAQTARQVLVADSPDALAADQGTLWDSGKVESNQSQWVPYAGKPLVKGARCWWKVRVWDQTGTPSPWSAPASFSVGPLAASDWKGEWIGADWMKNNEGPLPWLRKTITLDEVPTTATAYVCALGYYELYVNGQKVGDDVLSPAVSDYGKRGLYLTHDVTRHLVKGKNCVGLWLGRGWSLGVLESLRGRIMVEYRAGFLEDKGALYEDIIDLCLNQGLCERGLQYAERAKSRAMLDLLAYRLNLEIRPRAPADVPLIERLVALRSERDRLYRRWEELTAAVGC